MYHVRGPHPVLKLGHKKCLFMQFYFYLTKSDQNQIIVHKKSGCGPKSYKRDLTLCDLYILPYDLSVIMYPGVNSENITLFPKKIFEKSFPFFGILGKSFFMLTNVFKILWEFYWNMQIIMSIIWFTRHFCLFVAFGKSILCFCKIFPPSLWWTKRRYG